EELLMPVLIRCAGCDKKLKVPDASLGKTVRCPACGARFQAQEEALDVELADPQKRRSEDRLTGAPQPRPAAGRPRLYPDDEEPPRPWGGPRAGKGSSTGLVVGLVLGGVLLLVGVAVGLVFLVRGLSGGIPDGDWQTFRPPGGDCSILMPGKVDNAPVPG